ncbi:Ras-related protein Rab7 [Hibiscus syriacus]|uniref:Ras-related protein Rab7 n=1 Tax=Hibiscus syriacus TaxID=106335 RepID=A0A6A2XVV6_HIBSY|nr:Ras-related protein Rab7 [Hibiscus syriacus]
MLSTKSESDITSLAPSSPSRSPKRPVYYVQSPSRDSHDGDKSSTIQPSPMESPSHPSSVGRHSRNSSASRFSGIFRSSSGRKGGRKRDDKGWPECGVIMEEGSYDEFEDKAFALQSRNRGQELGSAQRFRWGRLGFLRGSNKNADYQWHLEDGCYNPATIFGIHVSSNPVNLAYSEITVATGQLKYYQPRKSHRIVSVVLEWEKVPLYGAGSSLTFTQNGAAEVPLILKFEVRSRGYVVGKLVRTKHRKQISCPLVIDSMKTKLIKFKKYECTYD